MQPKPMSFSLTDGTIDLLRAVSIADDRSMSAEVRHMIRSRAYQIIDSPNMAEIHKTKIRELLSSEEFAVAEISEAA